MAPRKSVAWNFLMLTCSLSPMAIFAYDRCGEENPISPDFCLRAGAQQRRRARYVASARVRPASNFAVAVARGPCCGKVRDANAWRTGVWPAGSGGLEHTRWPTRQRQRAPGAYHAFHDGGREEEFFAADIFDTAGGQRAGADATVSPLWRHGIGPAQWPPAPTPALPRGPRALLRPAFGARKACVSLLPQGRTLGQHRARGARNGAELARRRCSSARRSPPARRWPAGVGIPPPLC